jgi:hypothetical protein
MDENCSGAGASGRPAGAGAAAGAARRNLSRNVRRGVRRSGSAGNIGRSGVPNLWTKNDVLWTVIAFMDKKCIYGQYLHLWTRNVHLWTRNALYGHYLHLWTKSAFFMENKKYQPTFLAMMIYIIVRYLLN